MKSNIIYRVSSSVLALGSIICTFFLNFFTFTITMVLFNKTYNFSLFSAISQLSATGGTSASDDGETAQATVSTMSKLKEAVAPMWNDAITFFVLVGIVCIFALAIIVLSSSTNLHVPQAILSALGFILLVVAAICGSNALDCLLGDEPKVKLSSITLAMADKIDKDNILSTLGSALSKVQIASLSYGFYVVMAIFAVLFIWTIIAAISYNSDQPKRAFGRTRHEYRRKKPMRSLKSFKKQ